MPPEQASADAEAMGPASDVYSLGAILYELVTGRPPFKAQTPLDTLLQVLGEEPVAPHSLNGSVPADLETIILKCLEKDPRRRYQSAQELVDELERYLAGEPIQARPLGQWERTWRWCRRKPALAGLYGTAAVLLLMLGIGGPMVAFQQASLRSKADRATEAARQNLETAEMERQRADREAVAAKASAKEARENLKIAERNAYNTDMIMLQRYWEEKRFKQLTDRLKRYRDRDDLKGFEWYYWNQLVNGDFPAQVSHVDAVGSLAFSPDGSLLASGDENGAVKVCRWGTGEVLLSLNLKFDAFRVAFSPDGKMLITQEIVDPGNVNQEPCKLWELTTGARIPIPTGEASVDAVAFSSDGKKFVSATTNAGQKKTTFKVWGIREKQLLRTLSQDDFSVHSVSLSSDGSRVAAADVDGKVKVWSVTTGQAMFSLRQNSDHFTGVSFGGVWSELNVSFSPDGKLLSTGDNKIYDAFTGQGVTTLDGHADGLRGVSFSSDSKRVISSGSAGIGMWDATTGVLLSRWHHFSEVWIVVFSPNGKSFGFGTADGDVKLWGEGQSQQAFTVKTGGRIIAFSPDGKSVAIEDEHNAIKICGIEEVASALVPLKERSLIRSLSFSPDNKHVVATHVAGNWGLKLWDAASGEETLAVPALCGQFIIGPISFSSTGDRLGWMCFEEHLRVIDVSDGKELLRKTLASSVFAFSPKKDLFASIMDETTIKVWDWCGGQELRTLKSDVGGINGLAFSPDAKRIVSVSDESGDGKLTVWDLVTGEEVYTLQTSIGDREPRFSSDGKQMAIYDREDVKVWNVSDGTLLSMLDGGSGVYEYAFSPDGRRIVIGHASSIDDDSGTLGGPVTVWDVDSGQQLLTLRGHTDLVRDVHFSPDGKRVISTSDDDTIKIWGELMPLQPASADVQP